MAAPKGNNYAETITKERALEVFEQAISVISPKMYYLSHVADEVGVYRDWFLYVSKKFREDREVFRTVKRLYNRCESTVLQETTKGNIPQALGIFVLKAYHELKETSVVQNQNTEVKPIQVIREDD